MSLAISESRRSGERGRDYAYRILRHNIITMQLPPATVLNEAQLSEQLSMSRTPIREALILLKEECLVDIQPQRGSSVSLISLRLAGEGYFMRLTLENQMMRDLAGRLTAEQCSLLKENLLAQEKSISSGSNDVAADFFNLDDQMHRLLYLFSGRERMYESVTKVCSHYDRIRYLSSILNGNHSQSELLEQHRTLYYYLTLGIPLDETASTFYERHMGHWLKDAPQVIASWPEYFTD